MTHIIQDSQFTIHNSRFTNVLADLQNLSAKGVVYRPLSSDFPKLKLAIAWRQTETSSVVHEFVKMSKGVGNRKKEEGRRG